jgi:hypothetical protein
MTVKEQSAFGASLIEDTGFPALDASSADPGYMTIHVQPARIEVSAGTGALSLSGSKQKVWDLGNFRLQIAGLLCTHVSRIEPFTVHRDVLVETAGRGAVNLVPGKIDFPNLTVTLAESSAKSWYDWHRQFVIEGKNDESFERDGSLTFLAPNMLTELAKIDLHHLGIVKIAPAATAPPRDHVLRVTAELYCDEMVLSRPPPGATP